MGDLRKKRLTQTQIIALGFLGIILAGTLLLMLPIATKEGRVTGLFDALFTAVSATCVTGLVVVDTYEHWTVFGQIVIIWLIQIGGLGFMTVGTLFSIILGRKIGLKERGLLQESVNTLQIGGIVKLTKKILIGTFILEGIGALLLSIRFIPRLGLINGIYYSIFHSISAFCNAGFDLMGRYTAYSSFMEYYDDWLVNFTIMSLIVVGGIGFLVWDDLSKHKWHFKRYLLQTKIVLSASGILIFGGAILFFLLERNHLLADMSFSGKVCSSLFSSVTARTAGFNTLDIGAMTDGSKLLTIILMFIGGSPGSTAGGIKTTTFVVLLLCVISNIKHTHGFNIFNRRLEEDTIKRASAVFCTNLTLCMAATLLICGISPLPLTDVLFEVFSAIGTVGMSTGITRDLSMVSQFVIAFLMYCGRIGSLSFGLAFAEHKKSAPVQEPIEKITVG